MSDTEPTTVDEATTGNDAAEGTNGEPVPTINDAAKLIRLGTMTQSLMNSAREAPLDEDGRALLARIHSDTVASLADTMSEDLLDELKEFQLCIDCDGEDLPSEGELRIAQAQLVGWLQGLHQGFQAMAMAQQAAALQQLQQLQQGGAPGQPGQPGLPPGSNPIDANSRPGTYL